MQPPICLWVSLELAGACCHTLPPTTFMGSKVCPHCPVGLTCGFFIVVFLWVPEKTAFQETCGKAFWKPWCPFLLRTFPLEAGSQAKVTHDTGSSSCNHTRREHTVLRLPDSPPFPSSPIPPLIASGVSKAAEVPDNPSSASEQILDQFMEITTNRKPNSKTRKQMPVPIFSVSVCQLSLGVCWGQDPAELSTGAVCSPQRGQHLSHDSGPHPAVCSVPGAESGAQGKQ